MSRRGMPHQDSNFVSKGHPCPNPKCLSSDAAALYDDGHMHCFSCKKTWTPTDGEATSGVAPDGVRSPVPRHAQPVAEVEQLIASSQVKAIRSRGISQATCAHWDYRVRLNGKGEQEHIAVYKDPKGAFVKLRNTGTDGTDKRFAIVGKKPKAPQFYGQWLWPSRGKMVTIVGGEIDALTVSQLYGNKYAVLSPVTGEGSLAQHVRDNLDYLLGFEKIVLGMDNDEAGKAATEEAVSLLPPGRAYIAKWALKDPNEMLLKGLGEEVTRAIWNADAWRPDGIVDARDLTARCLEPTEVGTPWPWSYMTRWTYGRRPGETYLFGAGSGLGKTDILAEIIAADIQGRTKEGVEYPHQGWGIFAFEAGAATTKKSIAGKIAQRRFHIPDAQWTQEELVATMQRMDQSLWGLGGKLYINDSFGLADFDVIENRVHYMAKAYGVKHFLIDPIGATVTGAEDERQDLDDYALRWAKLHHSLGTNGYMTSHLTRPSLGASHEEGGKVSLKHFRGSNGLIMYSWFVFGLERNQQADDEMERTKTTMRSLKDRFTGNSTGKTESLHYDVLAGTLDTVNLGDDL